LVPPVIAPDDTLRRAGSQFRELGTHRRAAAYYPIGERERRREAMYRFFFWTAVATVVVWTAYSAYSALHFM